MGWLGPFVWRVPGEKTAELAKAESCRSEAAAAKFNRLTVHVEARSETSRDAGSIPAASIGFLGSEKAFLCFVRCLIVLFGYPAGGLRDE